MAQGPAFIHQIQTPASQQVQGPAFVHQVEGVPGAIQGPAFIHEIETPGQATSPIVESVMQEDGPRFPSPVTDAQMLIDSPLAPSPVSDAVMEALSNEHSSPVVDGVMNTIAAPTPTASPILEVPLEVLIQGPVVQNATVIQRDTLASFLTDVSFDTWQIDGDPLTLLVEYQQGGTGGTWLPATSQEFDRQHDPEGSFLRTDQRHGLEGYWRFNGGGGDDASQYDRDVTLVGGPATVTGLLGQALRFPGNPAIYLERPSDDEVYSLLGNTDFTLEVWVNFLDLTGDQVLIEKFTPPQGPGWSLVKLANNRFRFRWGGPPGTLIETDPVAVVDGSFHQIVVRRRQRVLTMFYDGAPVPFQIPPPEPLNAISASLNNLTFARRTDGTLPLNGDLDEIKLWTRPLSDAEIAETYADGAGKILDGTPTADPGLRFNFVWNVLRDLPEGTFDDVFVRLSVSNNPTTTVIVGPLTLSTTAPTVLDPLAASLQRRALAERTPGDFLGCGLIIPFRRGSRDFENACEEELIRACVFQILGTRAAVGEFPGDLQWRPDFGNKVWILRHRNNDSTLREEAAAFVVDALEWEPRVQVTSVLPETNPEDPNRLDIRVRYRIIDENVAENNVFLPEFEEVITI